jgi:energy-coupling factor transport system ATP-binding protein
MITIEDMSFQYKGSDAFALSSINLTIKKGEFIGIIGSSGAGKTSLTRCMNGIIPHHHTGDFYGAVTVHGLDTVTASLDQLSHFVGSVFQDIDGQMVASIVEDEILFGLENFSVPREEIESRLTGALDTLGISDLRYRSIATLSGGQKQKVAIAAIIALRPEILVLDEPTGELDPASSLAIFKMLRTLNREYGLTILVVEQKIMLLCEFVDRLIVMDRGNILFDDKVRAVLAHSDELERVGVHCPRVVTLCNELTQRGLYQGAVPIHIPEAKAMVEAVLNDRV